MRVVALYHPNNDEFSGMVQDYAREFEAYKHKSLELKSLETTEGADLAALYSIVRYPAMLVLSDTGSLVRLWEGAPLPLMDELSYYAQDASAAPPRLSHILPAAA